MSKTYVALMVDLLKEAEAEMERARKKHHNFQQRLGHVEQELLALENELLNLPGDFSQVRVEAMKRRKKQLEVTLADGFSLMDEIAEAVGKAEIRVEQLCCTASFVRERCASV